LLEAKVLTQEKKQDGVNKIFSFNDLFLMDEEAFLGEHFYVKEPQG